MFYQAMSSDFDRFLTRVDEDKGQESGSAAPPEGSDASDFVVPDPAFNDLTIEERKNTGGYLESTGIGTGKSDRGGVPQEEDGQEGSPLFREG